jgi:GNAT superfamily N-acetyltransferase
MQQEVYYIADADVTAVLNTALISLLSTCFTKPEDRVFRTRRYFHEMPAHRFVVPGDTQRQSVSPAEFSDLAAHLAVHDREITASGDRYRCGGIAEVAVAPGYRGRGLARRLLGSALEWMEERRFDFALLFGDPAVYKSSGFRAAPNSIRYRDYATGENRRGVFGRKAGTEAFMYRPLLGQDWSEGVIDLQGYKF